MSEAKQTVAQVLADHFLIQLVAPGVIQDRGLDPATPLSDVKMVIQRFAEGQDHSSGRWGDFVDNFSKLRRVWHSRLFFMLLALVLERKNPFAVLASSSDHNGTSLAPKVLGVAWCRAVRT